MLFIPRYGLITSNCFWRVNIAPFPLPPFNSKPTVPALLPPWLLFGGGGGGGGGCDIVVISVYPSTQRLFFRSKKKKHFSEFFAIHFEAQSIVTHLDGYTLFCAYFLQDAPHIGVEKLVAATS